MRGVFAGTLLLLAGCQSMKNAQSIEIDTMFFDLEAQFYQDDKDTTTIEKTDENGTIRQHWNWSDRKPWSDRIGTH